MSVKSVFTIGKKLSGKSILLRVDLNSDVYRGKIVESERIKAHAETIKYLLKKDAKVVILAHQGSPGGKDFISLKKHSRILRKYVKVKFVRDVIGKKALKSIAKLKNGQALLLDNVRFVEDEFHPGKNNLVKSLAHWFDYYVNDAFSIIHRNQTSIVSFPDILPAYAGPVLYSELANLKRLKSKMRKCLFILGGAKPEDLKPFFGRKILSTGKLSLLALKSHSYRLGKDDEGFKEQKSLIEELKKHPSNIRVPLDLAVENRGRREELTIEQLPTNHHIFDIGSETIEEYESEIKKLGKDSAVLFKGSVGMFEKKGFENGTKRILHAISKTKAFSVIAGGQSNDALKKFNLDRDNFGYVSLSGGALVKYLSGEKLVGLDTLN